MSRYAAMRSWLSTGAVKVVQARRQRLGVGDRIGVLIHKVLEEGQVQ